MIFNHIRDSRRIARKKARKMGNVVDMISSFKDITESIKKQRDIEISINRYVNFRGIKMRTDIIEYLQKEVYHRCKQPTNKFGMGCYYHIEAVVKNAEIT